MVMFFIITLVTILNITYQLYKHFCPSPNINPNGTYVLITGCGSGFGYTLAIELDKHGFHVFTGVCNIQNASSLKQQLSSRSVIFVLDIIKQKDIDAAYNMIKKNCRVINVSSISDFISFNTSSAYSPSKYALESFSDCLRREMVPRGLRVSIIEPGGMRTSFLNEQEIFSKTNYGMNFLWIFSNDREKILQIIDNPFINHAEDPLKAVRAIQHAVMNSNPQIRYRPG